MNRKLRWAARKSLRLALFPYLPIINGVIQPSAETRVWLGIDYIDGVAVVTSGASYRCFYALTSPPSPLSEFGEGEQNGSRQFFKSPRQ
jgi:hypothetical protein